MWMRVRVSSGIGRELRGVMSRMGSGMSVRKIVRVFGGFEILASGFADTLLAPYGSEILLRTEIVRSRTGKRRVIGGRSGRTGSY